MKSIDKIIFLLPVKIKLTMSLGEKIKNSIKTCHS